MRTLRILFASVLTIVGLAVGGMVPAAAQPGTKTKCKAVTAVATGQGGFLLDGTI
jgi:hypothetical protein